MCRVLPQLLLAFFLLGIPATARDPGTPELPANALRVPLVSQATDYTCGPAALLSILLYWNLDADLNESDLARSMGTTYENGTSPAQIIAFAKSRGLETKLRENLSLDDLRNALKAGETWMLMIQAWSDDPPVWGPPLPRWSERWGDGHYGVLVAMDSENIYLMDPSSRGQYGYMPLKEFVDRWHDLDFDPVQQVERKFNHAAITFRGESARTRYPEALERIQ